MHILNLKKPDFISNAKILPLKVQNQIKADLLQTKLAKILVKTKVEIFDLNFGLFFIFDLNS